MKRFTVLLACLLLVPGLLLAQHQGHQGHQGHAGHMMHGDANADPEAWRMPPMDMSMPMMPGMDSEVPPVGTFLPGRGVMADMLPEARPRETVELAHGDTLHLHASLVRRTLNGKTFVMYGYNEQYPGPLLKVDQGSTIIVQFHNNIEMPTTVHWHGLRLDNRFDGIPGMTQDPVESGEMFTYELYFPDSGIYWYHPHMREDIQQDMGLYGNMLVKPPTDDYYNPVNREEAIILDDILMDDVGLIPYGEESHTHALMGRFGNVMLVNGAPHYHLEVNKGDVVRFYLTNVANARTFNTVFGDGKVKVIGSDLSKYEREAHVGSVPIAPAERYIVEVLFDEPGMHYLTNSIQAINHFRGEFYSHVDTLGMIMVKDTPATQDFTDAFHTLREHADVQRDIATFRPLFDKEVDHELHLGVRVQDLPVPIMLSMEIDTLYVPPIEWNDAMPMMNWVSTGTQVEWLLEDVNTGRENMAINWDFELGDVVKLRLFNDPRTFHPMNHPFHVHGQRFLVTAIDGVPNPNLVWKDTATVPVGSTMDILIDMTTPGEWMMHCHIAEHLHSGMMLGFSVTEGGTDD